MPQPRQYRQRERARAVERTRERIAAAAAELHEEVGPARTTVSEVARRAGVGRLTVYNHFPDERALIAACQAHWLAHHPPPDPATWAEVGEPRERLRVALLAFYGWYRDTEAMAANVDRDARLVPALGELLDETRGPFEHAVLEGLTAGWGARGRRAARLRAVLATALGFPVWAALCSRGGLSDEEAAALMVALAREAVGDR